MKSLTRLDRIYLALWRKAWTMGEAGEALEIVLPTFSSAIATKAGLYRAAVYVRKGHIIDDIVRNSAEKYSPKIIKGPANDQPATLRFTPKVQLARLTAEMARLGITEADLLIETEASYINDVNIENFIPPNPFYER